MNHGGLIGGAVFDGLIAATARDAEATLLTLDQRAARTYQAVGAAFELL
jgi:predicted nucleic acid-binding protein